MKTSQAKIRTLIFRSLRALAGRLMAVGISAREFVELAKLAYVDAASAPKRISVARLVDKTGLSKHEVRRLREKLVGGEPLDFAIYPRPEGIVLQRWFTDPQYLDDNGEPKSLSRGPGTGTLTELILDSLPTQDPRRIIDRLFRYDHVIEPDPDAIRPRSRSALVPDDAEGLMANLHMSFYPICLAIEHNMTEPDINERWLHRTAFAQRVPEDHLPLIRRRIRERGSEIMLDVDEFMSSFVEGPPTDDDHNMIGMGVFYFEVEGKAAEID